MSLTQCPACRRLCFVKSASCPSCGRTFQLDELRGKVEAEERAFVTKYIGLSLSALILLLASLTFFLVRDYVNSAGAFSTRTTSSLIISRKGGA